jgi:hypothetical protein
LIRESRRDTNRRVLAAVFVLLRELTTTVLIEVDHGVVFVDFDQRVRPVGGLHHAPPLQMRREVERDGLAIPACEPRTLPKLGIPADDCSRGVDPSRKPNPFSSTQRSIFLSSVVSLVFNFF